MAAPEITPLPPAPLRSRYSEEFAQTAEDFVAALPQFGDEVNDSIQFVELRAGEAESAQQAASASETASEGYRDEAEDFKNAAAATVNFAGRWSDLTGALNTPAVVYHEGIYWNLLNNLADVTASEPAVNNSDWLKVYEVTAQNNLTATTDPTVNDDETLGYGPTSRWINTATDEFWLCISAGAGAANWQPATLTVDELGSAALADTADFDAAGTGATEAASAVGDHEAAANPHAQYAQLSGGANADFAAMPLVGGDPIVESDSNSDGEWTRWADGSQLTQGRVAWPSDTMTAFGNIFSSTLNNFTYPIPFLEKPGGNASGVNSAMWAGMNPPGETGYALRMLAESDRSSALNGTGVFTFSFSGRWK